VTGRAFVIGYDIADPRRLQRVHRAMCKHASPLEYSVFLLVGSEAYRQSCLAAVADLIDPDADDVRCYPLPARGLQTRIGRASLPEGIQWTGLPAGIA
jgi:CRISPR-associated protein Cas2